MNVKVFYLVIVGLLISGLSFSQTINPYATDENTVLLMHFDGDLTNSSALSNDGSQNGTGASYNSNVLPNLGQCLSLDGTSFITIPHDNNLSLTGDWTIEAWIKLTEFNSESASVIIRKPGDTDVYYSNYALEVHPWWGNIFHGFYFPNEEIRINTTSMSPNLNQWYHIAFKRNSESSAITLIVRDENFEIVSSSSNTFTNNEVLLSSQDLRIGEGLIGFIDEVRVSNIVRDFTQEPPSFPEELDIERMDNKINALNLHRMKYDSSPYSLTIDVLQLSDYETQKPSNALPFDCGYVDANGWVYVSEPTTAEQLEVFTDIDQAAVYYMCQSFLQYYYQATKIPLWFKSGFASYEADMRLDDGDIKTAFNNYDESLTSFEILNNTTIFSANNGFAISYMFGEFMGVLKTWSYHMIDIIDENTIAPVSWWDIETADQLFEIWKRYVSVRILEENEENRIKLNEETDHFKFYYRDAEEFWANYFSPVLEEAIIEYQKLYDFKVYEKFSYITMPECDFSAIGDRECINRYTGGTAWSSGLSSTSPIDENDFERFKRLIRHELGHLAQSHLPAGDMTAWINEGSAQFISHGPLSEEEIDQMQVQTDGVLNNAINYYGHLPTWEETKNYTSQSEVDHYLFGEIMLNFIYDIKGYSGVKDVIIDPESGIINLGFSSVEVFMTAYYSYLNKKFLKIEEPYYFTNYDAFIEKLTELTSSTENSAQLDEFWDALISSGNFPFVEGTKVAFLFRGTADTINWAGMFNEWDVNIDFGTQLGISNIWILEKEFLADTRCEYKIVRDGSEWIMDSNNPHPLVGDYENSELWMPDYKKHDEIIPRIEIAKGILSDNIIINSTNLGYTSQYRVYTPVGYSNLSSLPTIYVTDGQNYLDDNIGKMVIVLDNLIADELIEPVIAIFLDPRDPNDLSNDRRGIEYRNNTNFVNYVTKELIPEIEATYKSNSSANARAIMGASYGGYNAEYFSVKASDYFHNIGMNSPYLHPNEDYPIDSELLAANLDNLKLFLSYGVFDVEAERYFNRLKDIYDQKGKVFKYTIIGDGHTWQNFNRVIGDALKYFFKQVEGNGIINLRENNSVGIPIHLDETVTVSGIVTASNDFGNNGPAYIQDNQAGIAVHGSEFVSLLSKGDSITITGKVALYNGLTQLVYVEGESELIVHKNSNIPDSEIVSILDILNQTWNGVELLEGKLLQIDNVTFVETGTFSSNTNYQVTDGTNYLNVYIDADTDIDGMQIPLDFFSIIGCLGQYDNSEPYSFGYQLFPRNQNDFRSGENESDWETTSSDNFIFHYTNSELYSENLRLLIEKKFENLDYTIYEIWNNIQLLDRSSKIDVYLYDTDETFIDVPSYVRDWDVGYYLVEDNQLHIKVPSTTRQLKYFSNIEKAVVSVLARYIMVKKKGNEPTSGLSFGFGLYESGYSPDLTLIQNYLDTNNNTFPIPSTFDSWTELDEEINVELAYTYVFASIFRYGYLSPIRSGICCGYAQPYLDIWYQIIRIFFLLDIEDGGMRKFIEEDDFIIYSNSQEEANLVVEGLRLYADICEETYETRINHPLLVAIFGSSETYTYIQNGNIDAVVSGGEALSHSVLKSTTSVENLDTELNRILAKHNNTMQHEFTHNVLGYLSETRLPAWLNEGGAMNTPEQRVYGYIGMNVTYFQQHHDYWNDQNKFFPDLIYAFEENTSFGYHMSYSAFTFIQDNFSKETLLQFLKQSDDFSIIGYSGLIDFQTHLYETLYHRYLPTFLFNPHWDLETAFTPGANFTFDWEGNYIDDLVIEYSVDVMNSWSQISEVPFSTGSYSWNIPNSENCILRFSDKKHPEINFVFQILGDPPTFGKVFQMSFENGLSNGILNANNGRIKGNISFDPRDEQNGSYAKFDGQWDMISIEHYPKLSLRDDWTIQGDFLIENTTGVMNQKPVLLQKNAVSKYKRNYSISFNDNNQKHLHFEYFLEDNSTVNLEIENVSITEGNWYTFYFARSVENNIVEARVYDNLGNMLGNEIRELNGEGMVLTGAGTLCLSSGYFNANEECLQGGLDNIIISDIYHDALMLNDANNAPIVSDIPNQTIEEGSSFVIVNLDNFVSDVDHSNSELTWATTGEVELVVSINDDRVATISIPNTEWNGSETITFTATDPQGAADSNDAVFTVTNVNDDPVVSNIADQTIEGGSSFTPIQLDDFVTDIDNYDSEIIWSYSGNSGLVVDIDGNRVATISIPNTQWNGSETITFTATDPQGAADSNDAVFTVNPGIFTLPSNNFNIEVTSETCPNKENGQVTIVATESYSYTTTINDAPYTFSNTSNLTSNPLPVGVYDFCISVSGESYEQCFVIEIEPSNSAKATTSVSSNKVSIEMTAGTAPYTISVNGLEQLKTSASIFLVAIKHGDVIEVKTAKTCEGVYSKTIELLEGIVAYPNPTNGTFEIALPVSQKEVTIELYTIHSQLISIKTYPIVYGKVQLTIEDQPTGLYIAKVQLDTPVTLKIVKQ